ncbi:uncharacterized protein LOC129717141 [Wyeomyia smithii]|uniref:uncharacterized protein LOC129717141 n=1 Tax=Wyeomyia smithii TaxID=174621 RepID=UPI002467CA63|nr:uncharacterized protein LOC129717141 [Wyeomyia smithii]
MSLSKESYASVAVVLSAASIALEEEEGPIKRIRARRSVWLSEWITKRATDGFYVKLLSELLTESPRLYKNFIRMSKKDFDYVLKLVGPLISKQGTYMRNSIPAGERLALTLRFLATGDSFMSLRYLFRIPETTISRIIPKVLDAIWKVLKPLYMKVPSTEREWKAISTSLMITGIFLIFLGLSTVSLLSWWHPRTQEAYFITTRAHTA